MLLTLGAGLKRLRGVVYKKPMQSNLDVRPPLISDFSFRNTAGELERGSSA